MSRVSTDLWRHRFQVVRSTPDTVEVLSSHRSVLVALAWVWWRERFGRERGVWFRARATPQREDAQ